MSDDDDKNMLAYAAKSYFDSLLTNNEETKNETDNNQEVTEAVINDVRCLNESDDSMEKPTSSLNPPPAKVFDVICLSSDDEDDVVIYVNNSVQTNHNNERKRPSPYGSQETTIPKRRIDEYTQEHQGSSSSFVYVGSQPELSSSVTSNPCSSNVSSSVPINELLCSYYYKMQAVNDIQQIESSNQHQLENAEVSVVHDNQVLPNNNLNNDVDSDSDIECVFESIHNVVPQQRWVDSLEKAPENDSRKDETVSETNDGDILEEDEGEESDSVENESDDNNESEDEDEEDQEEPCFIYRTPSYDFINPFLNEHFHKSGLNSKELLLNFLTKLKQNGQHNDFLNHRSVQDAVFDVEQYALETRFHARSIKVSNRLRKLVEKEEDTANLAEEKAKCLSVFATDPSLPPKLFPFNQQSNGN